jgi:hypothetical protein
MIPVQEVSEIEIVDRIVGHEFPLPGNWSGYEIPVHFPLKQEKQRAVLMAALWALAGRLWTPAEAQPTVWLLMDNLHKDGAVLNLSRNARDWKPRYGLGLWPDQPPPRMTTPNDILDLEWGAKPRLPYHRVTWLGASGIVLQSAWTLMFGLGSTILTLVPGGGEQMTGQTREFLRQPIVDDSFREFPFYFPLLGKKALSQATALELEGWLGPALLYMRESEEDHALLLLVRILPEALREALHQTAFTTTRPRKR